MDFQLIALRIQTRAARPGTRGRGMPLSTAAGRPPGTASRLATAMQRPGTRGGNAGGGIALSSQVEVTDRPMTKGGLGGLKTGSRGPNRQVQDKSYFLGLLRAKINELRTECQKINKEFQEVQSESQTFLSYEKKAEILANEIKNLQGELGDYNTLNDKLNTDTDIRDVERDYDDHKSHNDVEERGLDGIFEEKKSKDSQVQALNDELKQETMMTDTMVANMPEKMRRKYMEMRNTNEHLLKSLEKDQQELDALNIKKENLEEELSMSHVKQEAVRIYDQINELEVKKAALLEEEKSNESPKEIRERLLEQVKQDNHEISTMDRQSSEMRENSEKLQEDLRQTDIDLEEMSGEKNQKYKELKKREETMNQFLDTYDEAMDAETGRLTQTEESVVSILESISRNMARTHSLPTPAELSNMKDDLSFKTQEMKHSEMTATGLAREDEKLRQDLEKVEQLENKVTKELSELQVKIDQMNKDLSTYSDTDNQRQEAEDLKQKLMDERVNLAKRAANIKTAVTSLASSYESLKTTLNENETYTQLGNLERKWQHLEQNNFVMKEFIASKAQECDYRPLSQKCASIVQEYNQLLIKNSARSSAAGM